MHAPPRFGDMMEPLTLYHDGSCPLCRLEIAHYRRQVGSEDLRFVDVSKEDAALGENLDRAAALRRFHVRTPDGRLVSGAPAFAAVWRRLPRWQWAARIADLPGMRGVLELGYRAFLPLRPSLARMVRAFSSKT